MAWLTAWVALVSIDGAFIALDAGHGGAQDGAAGPGKYLEKKFTLELAGRVKKRLEDQGHRVFLTRAKDDSIGLGERVAAVNGVQPDLLISLHANSMPTSAARKEITGVETYFLSAEASGDAAKHVAARENADLPKASARGRGDFLGDILADLSRTTAHAASSRLAYAVHQQLVLGTGAVDRGVQQAPFVVLMGVDAPAILVEAGFISHPEEGKKLRAARYQEALAEAIAQGVDAFLVKQ